MNLYRNLEHIRALNHSYWAARIAAELTFAANLSAVRAHKYDALLEDVAAALLSRARADGAITRGAAEEAEAALAPLSADAKSYKIRCISHAHIDMNWMWGYQETVGVTLDTFRTMLKMMDEFP
jgi:alpha-mannosidase